MTRVLVGLPTYDNTADARQILALQAAQRDNLYLDIKTHSVSLLAHSFNLFWCDALNDRTYDYFLLMHADIVPLAPVSWIRKMISEADKIHTDLFSIVSPVKSPQGYTSTALAGETKRKLTMHEVMQLPETFTGEHVQRLFGQDEGFLLVNTGLMLCDLRHNRDKWEDMHFGISDWIDRVDGKFIACNEPEDWDFSRQAHALGLRVAASRCVTIAHRGGTDYRNDVEWGVEHDV